MQHIVTPQEVARRKAVDVLEGFADSYHKELAEHFDLDLDDFIDALSFYTRWTLFQAVSRKHPMAKMLLNGIMDTIMHYSEGITAFTFANDYKAVMLEFIADIVNEGIYLYDETPIKITGVLYR
jgi:hypothetical protein